MQTETTVSVQMFAFNGLYILRCQRGVRVWYDHYPNFKWALWAARDYLY